MSQTKAQLIDGKSAEIEFTGGSASGPAISFTGDSNTGIYSPGADQVAVATNGTGRLFVDDQGRVGVGAAAVAGVNFNVQGSTPILRVTGASATNPTFQLSAAGITSWSQVVDASNSAFYISKDGTERLRITSAGLVGIGTSTFSYLANKLVIDKGSTANDGITIVSSNTSNACIWFADGTTGSEAYRGGIDYNHSTDKMQIYTGGLGHIAIDSAGNVGINTPNPSSALHVVGAALFNTAQSFIANSATGSVGTFQYNGTSIGDIGSGNQTLSGGSTGDVALTSRAGALVFGINTVEKARLDTSGRLLVGTSTASSTDNDANFPYLQLEGVIGDPSRAMLRCNGGTDQFGGPHLYLSRSRGTSSGSKTSVANDDMLGDILFLGADGADDRRAASIRAFVDGTPGANDMPGRLVFSTTADGASSPTERLRIDSSGNFRHTPGGATSSTYLSGGVENTTDYVFKAYRDGLFSTAIAFNTQDSGSASERARIDSSGRLLVGTSTARANIFRQGTTGITPFTQIESAINSYNNGLSVINNSASGFGAMLNLATSYSTSLNSNVIGSVNQQAGTINFLSNDGTNFVDCAQIRAEIDGTPGANDMPGRLVFSTTADGAASPTERMRISATGRTSCFSSEDAVYSRTAAAAGTSVAVFVGTHTSTDTSNGTISSIIWSNGNIVNTNNSYGSSSDIKLKENIVDANSQWNDLKALQVRKYNFKEGQTHTQIGLVAQEVELVSPGLVSESPDRDAEGNDLGTVTKSVNYSVLYMKAVKALQEAMERIETLEGMVAVNNITIDEQQHQLSTLAARLTALESA
jgi:hypothetical protein